MNVNQLLNALANAPKDAEVYVRNPDGRFGNLICPFFRLDELNVYLDAVEE